MTAPHLKTTIVWLILCLTTALSVGLSGGAPSTTIAVAVLGAAFMKVYLVLHYFMELDEAPLPWRAVFAGWTIIVFLVLSGLLLFAG